MSAPPPPPQSFPYDHLFKILTIGDAGVGKVRGATEGVFFYFLFVLVSVSRAEAAGFGCGDEDDCQTWTFGHKVSLVFGKGVGRFLVPACVLWG